MKKIIYFLVIMLFVSNIYAEGDLVIKSPTYEMDKIITLYSIPRCSGPIMIKVVDKTVKNKQFKSDYGYKINRCVLITNKTLTNSISQIWQCECNKKFNFQVLVNNDQQKKIYDYYIEYYLMYDYNKSKDLNDAYKRNIKLKNIYFIKPKKKISLSFIDGSSLKNMIVGVILFLILIVFWFYKWLKNNMDDEEEEEKDDFLF